jgi:hypothetical protein
MRSYSLSYLAMFICQARPTPAFPERRTKCSTTSSTAFLRPGLTANALAPKLVFTHTLLLSTIFSHFQPPHSTHDSNQQPRGSLQHSPCPAALTVAPELRYRLISSTTPEQLLATPHSDAYRSFRPNYTKSHPRHIPLGFDTPPSNGVNYRRSTSVADLRVLLVLRGLESRKELAQCQAAGLQPR